MLIHFLMLYKYICEQIIFSLPYSLCLALKSKKMNNRVIKYVSNYLGFGQTNLATYLDKCQNDFKKSKNYF